MPYDISCLIHTFGSHYTELTAAQIDVLVEWVLDMRSKYNQVGGMAISDGIDALLCSSPKGQYNYTLQSA